MASRRTFKLSWTKCRGRDGWHEPQDIPEDMAEDLENIDLFDGQMGSLRVGTTTPADLVGNLSGYTFPIRAMGSWVPAQDETKREAFWVDSTATKKLTRYRSADGLTDLTVGDAIGTATPITFAPLNGKLYISYDSSVNRLHVYDPDLSTTAIRRAGLATAAAPTVANTGAGTYAAVARYYRVCYTEQRSGVTVRRGELGPASTVFTPSGAGTHARVTKPAAISEGETHWELYVSADDAVYYGPLATTAVATTTYDDNSTITTLEDTYSLAPTDGANTPFPSTKFLCSNGTRLFGFGVWETAAGDSHTPQPGTVYFTPALDSSAVNDDERSSNTTTAVGKIVLSRESSGVDRGITMFGDSVIVFTSTSIFQLVPTGSANTPYRSVALSHTVGAVSHDSIVEGEDEFGTPCLYFLDPSRGPYRLGRDGLVWIGRDIADIWDKGADMRATVVAHGVYYSDRKQVWFWWTHELDLDDPIGGQVFYPDTCAVLQVDAMRRDDTGQMTGGWGRWTGNIRYISASAMMAIEKSDGSATRRLKPLMALWSGSGDVWIPAAQTTTDDGTTYEGVMKGRVMRPPDPTKRMSVVRAYVQGSSPQSIAFVLFFTLDYGADIVSFSSATVNQTKGIWKFEGAHSPGVYAMRPYLVLSSSATIAMEVDALWIECVQQEAI